MCRAGQPLPKGSKRVRLALRIRLPIRPLELADQVDAAERGAMKLKDLIYWFSRPRG